MQPHLQFLSVSLFCRFESVQERVATLLHQQHPHRKQQHELAAAHQATQQQQLVLHAKRQQLAIAQQQLRLQQLQLEAAATALHGAAAAKGKAKRRLVEAVGVLLGAEGWGHWRKLHGELVTRRSRMVVDVAAAYQVGWGARLGL